MKLGIIVPYRYREEHLKKFIPHTEKYLEKHNINSFSNNFWGWGGEDGDFRRRIEYENRKNN